MAVSGMKTQLLMIIDSHQHFWKYEPARHAWIDDKMKAIQKDFMPRNLRPVLDELRIDGCVSVQVDQREEETRFLLELAEEYPFIKAVVGWVDLRADNIEERLEYFSGFDNLAGFRHILQAEEPERMLETDFFRGINALHKYGFTYDILIFPRHLAAATELVRKFPDQKFVVDHLAKPNIRDGAFEQWSHKFRELGKADNVWCKASGLVTEADWGNWNPDGMMPYLDFAFEIFGTKRLLFGSDWPVCLLAGSYEQVYSLLADYMANFSDDERRDVLGSNALRFYEIDMKNPA